MSSNDINNLVAQIFLEIAKHERSIQITRQVLCESTDFDAHQIFYNLISNDNQNITYVDIINFLSSNEIQITEEEAKFIILFYDKNMDGKLCFEEFINLVKNEKSSINFKSNYSNDMRLSFNIKFSLCKLLEKEIYLTKSIIEMFKELRCKYGFNIHDIYHSVKSWNFITSDSIKKFLINNNSKFLESDINLIMRRLDINKDRKIDLCEFHAVLGYPKCNFCCLCIKCDNCGSSYCDKCFISNHNCSQHNSNYSNSNNSGFNKNTENENQNPYVNNDINAKIINKNNHNDNDEFSDNIASYDQLRSVSTINMNKGYNEKENIDKIQKFNHFLNFLMEGENKIENIKIELCQNEDFNVEDTFRLFEKNGRGILDLDDLKYGFGVVSIFPSDYNMGLFMKRYDLQKKGFISFADFYDIVVPFEKYIREDVEKRIPKTNCAEITLSRQVKNSLNKLFKFLIDFENRANIEKKSLEINFKDIFNVINNNNNQDYFEFPNFIEYLNHFGLLNNQNLNPDLLYIRLDKNRNGRIDFDEFVDELQAV